MGVILFELLTGERPFRAERDQKLLMQQILNADPPPPSQLNSKVPADLDTLCLKCLERDPSHRFPTAAALAQELHRFLHGEPIHSRPITQWERAWKWCQRNPAVASLSACVVITLLEGRERQDTLREPSLMIEVRTADPIRLGHERKERCHHAENHHTHHTLVSQRFMDGGILRGELGRGLHGSR